MVRNSRHLPTAAASPRAVAPFSADPGRGVPGVAAAPLETGVALKRTTGASAEQMKSVRPRHAQGRFPPRPARGGEG